MAALIILADFDKSCQEFKDVICETDNDESSSSENEHDKQFYWKYEAYLGINNYPVFDRHLCFGVFEDLQILRPPDNCTYGYSY